MSTDRSLDDWARLRQGGHASSSLEIPSIDTGIETGFGNVRLALGAAGELRLLLPIRGSERIDRVPDSRTLRIGTSTYRLGGQPIRYLDVTCVVRALDSVFADVAEEIMQRIVGGATPTAACFGTIDDFRALFAAVPTETTVQAMRGLVGELLMLIQLLRRDSRGWQLWRGPLMERHDFRADRLAIEVKTTARTSGQTITVTSIDQLLEPDEGRLHLRLFQLEEATSAPITVSALVAEALGLASAPAEVRALLAAIDCPDPDDPAWNRASFRLEGEVDYFVDDRFPRIVPADLTAGSLPPGVTGLTYSVDLAAARDCRLDEFASAAHLDAMIACLAR